MKRGVLVAAAALLVLAAGATLAPRFFRGGPVEPGPNSTQVVNAGAARPAPKDDPRIAYLLEPGARSGYYDVDTSDPLPILNETLLHGYRDPLRRAREQLAALGADGLRVAQRVIDQHWSDPDGYAHLSNAMEVVHRSDLPQAREMCLQMLRHPNDGLRKRAVEALEKHGKPEDFDAVAEVFQTIGPEFKESVALSLHEIDGARAEGLYLDWIERGEAAPLWTKIAPRLARARDPAVLARMRELWPKLPPMLSAMCAAACARAGDEAALASLREALASNERGRAETAIGALATAGVEDELDEIARTHATLRVRMMAINALAAPEFAKAHLETLRAGMTANDETVANACLYALAAIDDPQALDRAVAKLSDPQPATLVETMQALWEPMSRDPALARRVLDALLSWRDPELHQPLDEQLHLLKAIGQVPLRDAAELLHELSKSATGDIQGLPVERWLIEQAGNIGEPGQRVLAEAFPSETDPARRIDLIDGMGIRPTAFALETLIDWIEDDSTAPYEVLYIADRLTRMGTVQQVAPVLKRVALRATQADVRVALQSMLWNNYPGPR